MVTSVPATTPLCPQPKTLYVEKIGNTWGISLIWVALVGFVNTSLTLELYGVSIVALVCTIAFSFLVSKQRKRATSTLPVTYEVAVGFIYMVALLAVFMPCYDNPSSAIWRVPLIMFTTLIYHRCISPSTTPKEETQ